MNPYCNPLMCLVVLILEIVPKIIRNCIIQIMALFDPLVRNTSRMQWLHVLSTRKIYWYVVKPGTVEHETTEHGMPEHQIRNGKTRNN